MSAALDWYKREPTEMLKDTFGLPAEIRGYYFILQDVIMSHNGRIRCHPQDVAGSLGISVRKWNAARKVLSEFMVEVKPDVFSPLFKDQNEFISTLHTDYLLFKQRTYRDQKAENRAGSNKNNDLDKRPCTTREESEEVVEVVESEEVVIETNVSISDTQNELIPFEPDKPKATRKAPKIPFPVDWVLPDDWRADAIGRGMRPEMVDLEAKDFQSYHIEGGEKRPGWRRSWTTWVKNHTRDEAKNDTRSYNGAAQQFAGKNANMQSSFDAADEAAARRLRH